ncbi:MAG: hypothetical protein ABIH00_03050 [Armatimonadota bacterium]
MNYLLLLPPVAFVVILIFVALQLFVFGKYGVKSKNDAPGKRKVYACGEDVPVPMVNPEYSQFFSFAFFFTIMHVVALMITTFPAGSISMLAFALFYVVGGITCLFILFRK